MEEGLSAFEGVCWTLSPLCEVIRFKPDICEVMLGMEAMEGAGDAVGPSAGTDVLV